MRCSAVYLDVDVVQESDWLIQQFLQVWASILGWTGDKRPPPLFIWREQVMLCLLVWQNRFYCVLSFRNVLQLIIKLKKIYQNEVQCTRHEMSGTVSIKHSVVRFRKAITPNTAVFLPHDRRPLLAAELVCFFVETVFCAFLVTGRLLSLGILCVDLFFSQPCFVASNSSTYSLIRAVAEVGTYSRYTSCGTLK